MRRRDLLVAGGLLALAGRPARAAPADRDGAEWSDARALFALDDDLVHLSSFLFASHPKPVRDAIARHRRAFDRNPVSYVNDNHARFDRRVRAAAARYLGVKAPEVALTDSTTMGLGLVYSGLALRPGDDVLTSTHDHFATHDSLRIAAARTGATVRKVELYARDAPVTREGIVRALEDAIRDETRVVALTWVHSSTGVKLPLADLAAVVARANAGRAPAEQALLCVDGVHGLGVEDAGPHDLGVDVFVAGTHKSLYGPRGTGVVWARPRAHAALAPLIPSFTRGRGWGGRRTPGGFHAFEHRWALREAFELHERLGRARIAARVHALARRLKEGLLEDARVTLRTPLDDALSASIVAFHVKGMRPRAVVRRFEAASVIATVAPYKDATVRLAPAFFNTDDDVDRALAVLRG